jgi:hypothetical protein
MLDRRALTPEQKKQVLDDVLEVWLKKPELRLGQLIFNAISSRKNIYYVEDLDIVEHLKESVRALL